MKRVLVMLRRNVREARHRKIMREWSELFQAIGAVAEMFREETK